MKKTLIYILSLIIVVSAIVLPVSAYSLPAGTQVDAKSVILYNFESDAIVYENNSHERREVASLTKLMTALLVAESDSSPKTTQITVDKHSVEEILGTGASNASLKEGEIMSSYDLLASLLIASCCDSANALATYYGGSIEGFVDKMNAKAAELGMTDTLYINAHGLQSKKEQYTSAYDMLILIKEFSKYEYLTDLCSKARYTIAETNKTKERLMVATNYLIDPNADGYYRYATGLKTGYTDNAGRCLASTAEKDGSKYACILLGCKDKDENGKYIRPEFKITKTLYEWAFSNLKLAKVCGTDTPLAEVKVRYSPDTDHILVNAQEDVYTIIPKDAEKSIIVEPILERDNLKAPLKAGEKVGFAKIKVAGEVVRYVDLVLAEGCNYSLFANIFGIIKKIITSKITIIIFVLAVIVFLVFLGLNIYSNLKRKKRKKVYRYTELRRSTREDQNRNNQQ